MLPPEQLAAAKAAKRAAELAWQSERSVIIDGFTIRPAIGRTGGSKNTGWELCPPRDLGPIWYLATKDAAIESIGRYLRRYGK